MRPDGGSPDSAEPKRGGRDDAPESVKSGLEIVKALCAFFMVFVHGFAFLASDIGNIDVIDPKGVWFPMLIGAAFLGMFPLTLPVAAGAGFRLYLERAIPGGRLHWIKLEPVLRAAAVLAILGHLVGLLGFESSLVTWDVLHLVAVAYVIIALLLKRRNMLLLWLLAAAVLLGTEPLRAAFPLPASWPRHPNVLHVLRGILLGASDGPLQAWSVFPWLFSVIAGFGVAHARLRFAGQRFSDVAMFLVGLVCLTIPAARGELFPALDPRNFWGAAMFQPPAAHVLGLVGAFIVFSVIFTRLAKGRTFARYGLVNTFSQGILWIYVTHQIVARPGADLVKQTFGLGFDDTPLRDPLGFEWGEMAFHLGYLYVLVLLAFSYGVGCLSVYLSRLRFRFVFEKAT